MYKTLNLGGVEYRYAIYGCEGSDNYGIFLLGALQEIATVEFFSKYFARTLNTIVIEAPGTGENAVLSGTVTIREQSKMVLDLIQCLGVEEAHIFAVSYGTAIGVELCDIWNGVKSLSVACGVPGIPESARMATIDVIAAARRDRKTFANTFVNVLTVDKDTIPKNDVIRRSVIRSVSKYDDYRAISFIENSIRLLAHKPTNLAAVSMPAVVIVGEHDPYATLKITKGFADQLQNAHYVVLKDADHLLHLQQPEKLAQALIALAKNQIRTTEEFKQLAS
ncbi:alpha/beta fold hydrolase [Marinomonas mediterranea]|jgi:hypothetical protein|uniref:Alpha/beta hydrolase fold protein n=1 Tax=Marinomonas mediterranea (strain ATCC 700492 / JCM 21426 / NBRC 103028 / MMB-1) TaxID=717774 RepID=F2K251_MARM1|nr:alpha/beta hydrolase [Marinomonas mediterranea]ADZ91129.1 alpha/beta hydrolase fold protein [Marinomonas mediterranea MMB-1]WCN17259.1 alpha/beta fold hydrolase [Marinomonas mediterranea MMB-1]